MLTYNVVREVRPASTPSLMAGMALFCIDLEKKFVQVVSVRRLLST